jgi:hypothetical protein
MKTYAKVEWTAEDIKTLREDWTTEQAEEFLQNNQRRIQDRLVELGWDVIETLISIDGK